MKKHSSNGERRRKMRANRAKLHRRFKTAELDEPSSSRLSFDRIIGLFCQNRHAILVGLAVTIGLINLFTALALLKRLNAPDPASLACQLDSSELRTVASAQDLEIKKPNELQQQIAKIIKNAPMSAMVDEIAQKDRAVAAYLVGIAMKESKYGTYSPKKNGADCYNYWGYRGKENTTKSGYSCFDSPAHAVSVVGGKIESMLKGGPRTPAQMISWKCGSTCAGHDPQSVTKWISDVSINYYLINPGKQLAKRN